jgi:hypothetical protein
MFRTLVIAVTIFGYSALALAGGSAESVRVISLAISDTTDYVLIVAPEPTDGVAGYSDPFLGQCKRFEVHGTFSRLKGALPWTKSNVTRRAHIEALTYLLNAQRSRQIVKFGWMGNGFVAIDANTPCIVRSRALQMIVDGDNTFVMSFHDVV